MFPLVLVFRELLCSRISSRLFETLQSLFWSVFGLLNLYVTNVKARHEFTEFVGATMFGTYNVISLVVLLNMLIAMMNNSYQLIAVSNCFTMGASLGFWRRHSAVVPIASSMKQSDRLSEYPLVSYSSAFFPEQCCLQS